MNIKFFCPRCKSENEEDASNKCIPYIDECPMTICDNWEDSVNRIIEYEYNCQICGDSGRSYPTLEEPDGVICECQLW